MEMCTQYLDQYNKRWQQRIIKTSFVAATVILIFEVTYFFILTMIGLRDQTIVEYILHYILFPTGIIFSFCIIGWFIVYRSKQSSDTKSLVAILTTVSICAVACSVHNIFSATLCSFFVPLAVSTVFGKRRITNTIGLVCLLCEILAMCFASMDLRGQSPYFILDCLMLFIVFGISWYATLLLMKSEQEKRLNIERMLHLENEVTIRKQQEEKLRLQLEHHQIIMDQTTDILFEWDIHEDKLHFSANWFKKFGYEPIKSKISNRIPFSENIHPKDVPAFINIMNERKNGVPYSEAEFRIKDNDNQFHWCRIRATTQFDDNGQPIKAVGVILDISEEKHEKLTLLQMARQDALSGIYNKETTNATIKQRMKQLDSSTLLQALLIIDVDYFKIINDTYGHMTGDNIISAIAAQLKNNTRSSDVIGRIGGDEFLVYINHLESKDIALKIAQKLHAALGLLTPKQGEAPITCSIGMAVFPHGVIAYSDLFQHADEALYHHKRNGRNGVSLYENIEA